MDDNDQWESILLRKFEVPLIMGGHSHHCTGSILHQDEIGNENGHSGLRHRIQTIGSREDTLFFRCLSGPFYLVLPSHPFDEFSYGLLLGSSL